MTNEEAIMEISRNHCIPCKEISNEKTCDGCYFQKALFALADQIRGPKKPKVYKAHPRDICLCPVCNSTFIERRGVKMNYCPNCGQAIDWNEVEG